MKTHERLSLGSTAGAVLLFFVASAILAAGCALPEQPSRDNLLTGHALGTYYRVRLVTEEPLTRAALEPIEAAVLDALNNVNEKMSTYRPDSELSAFNALESTEPFPLSPHTLVVFDKPLRVSEATGGAFDVTIGPLVNAWGFGPGRWDLEPEPPPEDELEALLERVGYELLELDLEARTIRKTRPDVYADLSGVAKGYAADEAARALDRLDIPNYLVELGGEIVTRGRNARGETWTVGVEHPTEPPETLYAVIALDGRAMATSGDYRNFFEYEGVRYSHAINPATGWPVAHNLTSVSVLHEESAWADAWATGLLVLGPREGVDVAMEHALDALFIIEIEEGRFGHVMTGDFAGALARPIEAGEAIAP